MPIYSSFWGTSSIRGWLFNKSVTTHSHSFLKEGSPVRPLRGLWDLFSFWSFFKVLMDPYTMEICLLRSLWGYLLCLIFLSLAKRAMWPFLLTSGFDVRRISFYRRNVIPSWQSYHMGNRTNEICLTPYMALFWLLSFQGPGRKQPLVPFFWCFC